MVKVISIGIGGECSAAASRRSRVGLVGLLLGVGLLGLGDQVVELGLELLRLGRGACWTSAVGPGRSRRRSCAPSAAGRSGSFWRRSRAATPYSRTIASFSIASIVPGSSSAVDRDPAVEQQPGVVAGRGRSRNARSPRPGVPPSMWLRNSSSWPTSIPLICGRPSRVDEGQRPLDRHPGRHPGPELLGLVVEEPGPVGVGLPDLVGLRPRSRRSSRRCSGSGRPG